MALKVQGTTVVDDSRQLDNITVATISGIQYPTADGINRQVLMTDGSGTLSFESLDTIQTSCVNSTTSIIPKGTPVYQTGTAGNSMEIAPADASDPNKMPAVGVVATDIAANGGEGSVIHMGQISGVDTSTFAEGDTMYVAVGGGFTNTPPGGQSNLIQNLGRVTKIHATNGGGVVMGSGRANAAPNLNEGNILIGDATNHTSITSLDSALSARDMATQTWVTSQSYLTSETTTSLSIAGNTLSYVDEVGATTNIDLSLYIDDTNLARLTSGTVDGGTGIATFTRDDASTFTVDFSSLFDDTNLSRISSGSFSVATGDLTLARDDASVAATINLDGRYLQNYTVSESDVIAHQAAITITESQISDLSHFDGAYSSLSGAPTGISAFTNDAGYASITMSISAPTSPDAGDLWWDPESAQLFIYYTDDDSSQWIEATPPPAALSSLLELADVGADGTAGQVLTTDGAGNFTFTSVTGGSSYTDADVETYLNGNVGGHIIPDTDITYDLGSATNRWRDLYLSGNTIHMDGTKISRDDTTGDLQILDSNDNLRGIKVKSLELDGPVYGTISQTSDAALKSNVTTIQNSLDKVSNLRGVDYTLTATGKEGIGFIAQEVEEVLPQLVQTDENTGLKSVAYSNMTGILVEAVKELKELVEAQQATINAMQQQINELGG